MKWFRRIGLLLAAMFAFMALVSCAPKKIYIPVISKGIQQQFWQTMKSGAEAAAKQYGVQITFEGPLTEADIQPQVQMLVNDMAKNPSAICLAALDTSSVMDQLNQAIKKKIPIIGFDSGVPNAPPGTIWATAATDNYDAAGTAADHMYDAVKDKIAAATAAHPVTIVDFNQDAASQSVTDRGKGFRDEMIKNITSDGKHSAADIRVQGNPAYIAPESPTSGKAIIIDVQVARSPKDTEITTTAQAILNRVKKDNILGIFCSNEGAARAVLSSSNDGAALPKQYPGLVVIGFEAGKAQKAAVKNKYFLGAIAEDPYNIGFQAVYLAWQAVKGQWSRSNVDTGAVWWDSTNMDDGEVANLLYD